MEKNSTAADRTEETADEYQGSVSTGFKNVKNDIADKLHKVAEALNNKATAANAQSGMAQYVYQVSGWLDQSAEYVRQFDYEQAEAEVREYVERSPGRSLLIAGGAGLIIGAILRRR